jgi:hypothetical protein
MIFDKDWFGTKSGRPPLDTTHLTTFGRYPAAHKAAIPLVKILPAAPVEAPKVAIFRFFISGALQEKSIASTTR